MKHIVLNIGMNVGDRKDATNVALAIRELIRQWIGAVHHLEHGVLDYGDGREKTFIIEFDTQVEYDPVPRIANMARVLQQKTIAIKDGNFVALVKADGRYTQRNFNLTKFFDLKGARMYGAPQKPEGTGGGKPVETKTTFDFELWLSQLPAAVKKDDLDALRKEVDKLSETRRRGDTSLHTELRVVAEAHNKLVDRVEALHQQLQELSRKTNALDEIVAKGQSAQRTAGWMAGAGSSSPIRDADRSNITVTLTRDEWSAVRGGLATARNYAPERYNNGKIVWGKVQQRIYEQTIGK